MFLIAISLLFFLIFFKKYFDVLQIKGKRQGYAEPIVQYFSYIFTAFIFTINMTFTAMQISRLAELTEKI